MTVRGFGGSIGSTVRFDGSTVRRFDGSGVRRFGGSTVRRFERFGRSICVGD
jgi:hypothetical protein